MGPTSFGFFLLFFSGFGEEVELDLINVMIKLNEYCFLKM